MHLTAFQAGKGDCLLLENEARTKRILIDGGMGPAHREHVAPFLDGLRKKKKSIDVVYVSHIDDDHIGGVLELLDAEAAWRVHQHQLDNDNPNHAEPKSPRPPAVGRLYHNAFHDQVDDNKGEIEDMLAASARALSASERSWARELARVQQDLATSVSQGIRVSQRIKKGALNIPLNPDSDGKLMLVRTPQGAIALGSLRLSIIGPFQEDLSNLRKEWNAWLRANKVAVEKLRTRAIADEKLLKNDVTSALAPSLAETQLFEQAGIALAKELGKRKEVTTPNLASLMFLAREGDQTILLTGDGHADDILRGLEHAGAFVGGDRLNVDVLKIQHHGATANIHKEFCDRVGARHYVFSGNGEHENPELDVVELVYDRFMATNQPKATFWFTSTSKLSSSAAGRAHMREVERLVAKRKASSKGRLAAKFVSGHSIRIV
jgi:beta-lactamase superfamily II metal-dependent hydrolase